ncbi:MAG: lycopene cyclase domain-containing protein [Bacteroidales bacterium]|nr:lycopene cyclase domain-containing protein [Bacteroidales bacterium]MCF8402929.1 lycopene cyclase domain-containing protein [Bacteroidales bacterium]
MYTYLLINLLAISIPFIASFDKRLNFYKQWKFFIPANLLTLLIFIVWDIYFTYLGIWGFNPKHLSGINLVNLPIEEWMFFIAIPYACVFTYEALNYLVKKDYFGKAANTISWVLVVILMSVGILFYERLYTSVTFISTALFILVHIYVIKSNYLGRFYFTYLFILIPFFIVNGLLTGSFIEQEVVWYDNTQNLGIRLFTIPVEDSVYGLLLIMMNVTFLELFRGKRKPVLKPV